jgi:HD-GYP domain-containing protein (c-di-GMP phosphodiesterase class II)
MSAESRTAELVGALSLATDLSIGFPPETAVRTSVLAVRLGRAIGLSDNLLRDAYYAGLLRFLGCTGFSHEQAWFNGGDDIGFLRTYADVDLGSMRQMVGRTLTALAEGQGPVGRARAVARFLGDPRNGSSVAAAHCATAVTLAARLGMSDGVRRALGQMYERWDGRGAPDGLKGPAIDPVARILHVAHVAEVYVRLGGEAAARAEIARRRDKHFDPDCVDAFLGASARLLDGLAAPSIWDEFLLSEPGPVRILRPADLPSVALAFAHFADIKSPYMLGHSTSVADLARAAGREAGLDVAECDQLYLAGLVHEIGRVSVPNGIWDKPGPLNDSEWDRVRNHGNETLRILSRAALLRPIAGLASAAHERLDGSGHPRQLPGVALGRAARLLAAADVCVALSEERAHRAAKSRGETARILADCVAGGLLDPDAVRGVARCTGLKSPSLKRVLPDGLSEREAEVLCLVARGLSNKAIAGRLGVSPRTVQTHVMHIFDKTGMRGRAAAALYAVDRGLANNQHFGG